MSQKKLYSFKDLSPEAQEKAVIYARETCVAPGVEITDELIQIFLNNPDNLFYKEGDPQLIPEKPLEEIVICPDCSTPLPEANRNKYNALILCDVCFKARKILDLIEVFKNLTYMEKADLLGHFEKIKEESRDDSVDQTICCKCHHFPVENVPESQLTDKDGKPYCHFCLDTITREQKMAEERREYIQDCIKTGKEVPLGEVLIADLESLNPHQTIYTPSVNIMRVYGRIFMYVFKFATGNTAVNITI
jgi:formylmethanofuran dehydrogenase subunit E